MLKEGIINEIGRFCDKNDIYKLYMREENG